MEQRKFVICPSLADSHISDVIRECNCCGRFFAQCCEIYKSSGSNNFYQSSKYGNCCHYNTSLVFTDGACSKNGQNDAKAGLGIVIGANREDCLSITVDNEVDYGATRTSQRAELLAAIEGLKNLEELHQSEKKKTHRTPVIHREEPNWARYIVVTDSEYVVKGITEWFPVWRVSHCQLVKLYTLFNEWNYL